MDFRIDSDTQDLVALARDICASRHGDEVLAELDGRFGPGHESGGTDRASARFNAELWRALVEGGVVQALAPESLGGGLGTVAAVLVLRELGRSLAPVPLATAVTASHALDAAEAASAASSVSEGADVVAVPAIATGLQPEPGGELAHVPWAPIADMLCVPTPTGVRVVRLPDADVDVERLVPVDFSCAGRVRMGSDVGEFHAWEPGAAAREGLRRRIVAAAYQWGVLESALERTAAYASERRQFGRPIGTFQAVAGRVADGLIDVDAVRLATLRAADELDRSSGDDIAAAHAATAAAHYWACEAGHRVAHTAVHIHGGTGLDRAEPVHRYFVAAKAGEFRDGGVTAQLLDLGNQLVAQGDPWE